VPRGLCAGPVQRRCSPFGHTPAQVALFEDIEAFYNRQRRHSSLGYISPVDELAALPQKLAA
jgi:transposase InsO family protein